MLFTQGQGQQILALQEYFKNLAIRVSEVVLTEIGDFLVGYLI